MKITLLFSERTTKHTISAAAKHALRGKEIKTANVSFPLFQRGFVSFCHVTDLGQII